MFTPGKNSYSTGETYTTVGSTQRVSAAIYCLEVNYDPGPLYTGEQRCNATSCALGVPLNYFVRVDSFLNITTSDADRDLLLQLIKSNVTDLHAGQFPVDMNATMVHQIDAVSSCLDSGNAGFWGFTPALVCVQGVLSGCTGSVSNLEGVAVTACGVKLLDLPSAQYDGQIGIVFSGAINVTGETVPPNATQIAKPATSTSPSSGAVEAMEVSGLGSLVVLIALTMLWTS